MANLLNLIEKEMKVAMTLTGAKSISEITQDSLVQGLGKELPAALAPMARECSKGWEISAIPPPYTRGSMLNIVLTNQKFRQILATSSVFANTGFRLHIIEPMGFARDDKRLRARGAGLSRVYRRYAQS